MTVYAIDALDVLFLRDPRPFEGGQTRQAASEFPPSPLTMQGFVRAALIDQQLADSSFDDYRNSRAAFQSIAERYGWGNDVGRVQLRGPVLATSSSASSAATLWLPTPRDLVKITVRHGETTEETGARLLQPTRSQRMAQVGRQNPVDGLMQSLLPLALSSQPGVEFEPPTTPFISDEWFARTLEGGELGVDAVNPPSLFDAESRVGISRDNRTGVVKQGMLYTAQVVRPRPSLRILTDLTIRDENTVAPLDSALMRLGGDGHLATLQPVSDYLSLHDVFRTLMDHGGATASRLREQVRAGGGRFKLCFATPALFARGWLPDGVMSNGQVELAGSTCRLVAAAVGKAHVISGWDLQSGRPKPLWATAPSGSVYFFEPDPILSGNDLDEFVERLFKDHYGQNFRPKEVGSVDGDPDWAERRRLAQIGFGLTFVGSWDYV